MKKNISKMGHFGISQGKKKDIQTDKKNQTDRNTNIQQEIASGHKQKKVSFRIQNSFHYLHP